MAVPWNGASPTTQTNEQSVPTLPSLPPKVPSAETVTFEPSPATPFATDGRAVAQAPLSVTRGKKPLPSVPIPPSILPARMRLPAGRAMVLALLVLLVVGSGGIGATLYMTTHRPPTNTIAVMLVTPTAAAIIIPTPSTGPATPPVVNAQPKHLPGGLEYIDIKTGTGAVVQDRSSINVQYTGWLQSNGKKLDSTYDRGGQPFSLTVGQGQVIEGWDKGLVGMKVGGMRRLIIPPSLGYGAQGSPPTIPANATLIFDVTVVS